MNEVASPPPERPSKCPACGQKIRKLNPHRMDRQKVLVLELLGKAWVEGTDEGWVFVERGHAARVGGERVKAPYCALEHAIRMTWFGLVERGEFRSGLYRITQKGLNFLIGRASVPTVIYCKDGEVIETSDTQAFIGGVRNVILDKPYWDRYASIQVPDPRQPTFWDE